MWESKIQTLYVKTSGERICQGDVLRDVEFAFNDPRNPRFENKVHLSYAIVMSQDCDLDIDFKSRKIGATQADKNLATILLCPAYPSEPFYSGTHIEGWNMQKFNTTDAKKLQQNDRYNRYHFLEKDIQFSIPDLVLDFKHFYTAPYAILNTEYPRLYLATVNELFRERLSQRFANYLSRFGLPNTNED